MPNLTEILERNLRRVRGRIDAACARRGRPPGSVRLVAVTKMVDLDIIRALLQLGVRDLGENRVQQLLERAAAVAGAPEADFEAGPDPQRPVWHMIGHLQRNKVRALLRVVRVVHSVDSERLVAELQAQAARLGVYVDILVEVNVAGEAQKTGATLDEACRIVAAAAAADRLRVRGLMTMAPLAEEAEASRPHFARLARLLDELRAAGVAPPGCRHLSMGMSHDFEVAVEEGATLVRIGTTLYDGLPLAGAASPAGPAA